LYCRVDLSIQVDGWGGTGDGGETKQYTLDVLNIDRGLLLLLLMGMPLQLRKQSFIYK
jgi:hypothetical protein